MTSTSLSSPRGFSTRYSCSDLTDRPNSSWWTDIHNIGMALKEWGLMLARGETYCVLVATSMAMPQAPLSMILAVPCILVYNTPWWAHLDTPWCWLGVRPIVSWWQPQWQCPRHLCRGSSQCLAYLPTIYISINCAPNWLSSRSGLIQPTHTHPSSRPRSIMNTNIQKKDIIIYYHYYCFSMCSSSLSLICSCVSILILQWLSSPHILTQHGLSHDTLQWLKKTKRLQSWFW